jgi:hypothetical protein
MWTSTRSCRHRGKQCAGRLFGHPAQPPGIPNRILLQPRGKGKISNSHRILTLAPLFVGPQIINFVPRIIAGDHVPSGCGPDHELSAAPHTPSTPHSAGVIAIVCRFVSGIVRGVLTVCLTREQPAEQHKSCLSGDAARRTPNWPQPLPRTSWRRG